MFEVKLIKVKIIINDNNDDDKCKDELTLHHIIMIVMI